MHFLSRNFGGKIYFVYSFFKQILPACYAYPKTEANLKKLEHAVAVFNTLLARQGGSYVTGSTTKYFTRFLNHVLNRN